MFVNLFKIIPEYLNRCVCAVGSGDMFVGREGDGGLGIDFADDIEPVLRVIKSSIIVVEELNSPKEFDE